MGDADGGQFDLEVRVGGGVGPAEAAVEGTPVEDDERAFAGAGADQAVLGQLGQGRADRVPADPEPAGQFDLTGQPGATPYQPGADLPIQDGRDALVFEPLGSGWWGAGDLGPHLGDRLLAADGAGAGEQLYDESEGQCDQDAEVGVGPGAVLGAQAERVQQVAL